MPKFGKWFKRQKEKAPEAGGETAVGNVRSRKIGTEGSAELPVVTYSSPGSRWVDPKLGFDYKSAGFPHLFEVNWMIGQKDVVSDDPNFKGGTQAPLLRPLLRMVAVYVATLHSVDSGNIRYHYYRKKEAPGYLKIDANSEFIAVAFDTQVLARHEILGELERIRATQMHVQSIKSESFSFVPIVLFGAEENKVYYLETMYGVPSPNAYFNSCSLDFLAVFLRHHLKYDADQLQVAISKWISQSEYGTAVGLLKFEPLMEKQIEECPDEFRDELVKQVLSAISRRVTRTADSGPELTH